jgi:hypothetical protein
MVCIQAPIERWHDAQNIKMSQYISFVIDPKSATFWEHGCTESRGLMMDLSGTQYYKFRTLLTACIIQRNADPLLEKCFWDFVKL